MCTAKNINRKTVAKYCKTTLTSSHAMTVQFTTYFLEHLIEIVIKYNNPRHIHANMVSAMIE